MISVTIPTTDVNSESAVIVRWYVDDRSAVAVGDPLVEIETSKAILDVDAPDGGVLLRLRAEGEQLKIDQPLGYLFDSVEALERYERERSSAAPTSDEFTGRITVPARRRAEELGLDIDEIARGTQELVTTKLVDAFAVRGAGSTATDLPDPIAARPGVKRLVLIGAGLGATQVLDILVHDESQQAVAIVDDDPARFGEQIEGIPVVGATDRALSLFAEGAFDAAVIAVGTSVPARTRLRKRCEEAGVPLANAIDPTVRITTGVRMGTGNIVCAHCHFGVGTVVGDNNMISAHNSFDHHSEIGSDNTTGPGCVTSGLVKIGDRCRFGMGVLIEPRVTIGSGAQIASGAVIVGSVPPDHAVKTKLITTAVLPVRQEIPR
jgi:sugar O-acyltransferase (sialic acid O-acetyltransferase NeuD family)